MRGEQIAHAQPLDGPNGQINRCANCQTINQPGAAICSNCFQPLSLIGREAGNGARGGRVTLDASLFEDEPPKTSKGKGPSRLAQAAAKRFNQTGELGDQNADMPDWLASLRTTSQTPGQAGRTGFTEELAAMSNSNEPEPPLLAEEEEPFKPIGPMANNMGAVPPGRAIATGELPEWLLDLRSTAPDEAAAVAFEPAPTPVEQPTVAPLQPESLPDFLVDADAPFSFNLTPKGIDASSQTDALNVMPTTDSLGGGIPDWLRDLTGSNAGVPLDRNQNNHNSNDVATEEAENNAMPNWLHDVSKGGGDAGRPIFGDAEVERTLNFAFDEENNNVANNTNFNLEDTDLLNFGPLAPHETDKLRRGLTDELAALPDLKENSEEEIQPFDFNDTLTFPNVIKPAVSTNPLPANENLEPATDLPQTAATNAENLEGPPWGKGLAPWLQGIKPPVLEPEANLETEDAANPRESIVSLAGTEELPPWLSQAATIAEPPLTSDSEPEENPIIGESPERITETRRFSLRDMLHQTEDLVKPWLEEDATLSPYNRFSSGETAPTKITNQNAAPPNVPSAEVNNPNPQSFAAPDPAQEAAQFEDLLKAEPGEQEAPNWLKDMLAGKPVPPVNTYGSSGRKVTSYTPMRTEEAGQTDDLPDWLQGDKQDETPTLADFATAAPEQPINSPIAENPEEANLLENLFASLSSENAPVEKTAEPPEWLREQSQNAAPVISIPEELPDWLNDSSHVTEAALPAEPEIAAIAPIKVTPTPVETKAEELTDKATPAGFNSLGEVNLLSDTDVPAWLRAAAQPKQNNPIPAAAVATTNSNEAAPTNTLPAWLRAIGTAAPVQEPETGQDFSMADFAGGEPIVEVPPQLAGAAVLAALLRNTPTTTAQPATKAAATRRKFNNGLAIRYLLSLLLIVVVLLGLLSPLTTNRLAITPPVQNFYNVMDSLSSGQKVLEVYDWEADKTGEMLPMAQAVTQHLMSKRIQLATISLNPQGPALANQVTQELATNPIYGNSSFYKYGQGYVNLGFVPGSEAAVNSLFSQIGTLPDYNNDQPASSYPAMSGINSLSDFNLVVVLAGDETSVRTWIEQFGIRPGANLLLGVPSSVGPMAQPYAFAPPSANVNLQGSLVRAQGLIVGLDGVAQYQQLLSDKNIVIDTRISSGQRLTAQSLAALLLVVVLVVANIIYFVRKRD